jgi:hypothetical protein
LIALATAPGDGEVTVVVGDETLGDDDPLLAQLLAAATAGAPPAGPAYKCAPIRLAMNGDAPKPKGRLCAEQWGFNLHAATRVHGNDKQGREHLCRYILRPPFANHRLQTLPDGKVQLGFKRPWSDGTNAVVLAPHAFIARLAAIIPPPRRHVTRYFGVLSSHSALRARIIPTAADATTLGANFCAALSTSNSSAQIAKATSALSRLSKRKALTIGPTDTSAICASALRPHCLAGPILALFRKFASFSGKNGLLLACLFGLLNAKSRANSGLALLLPWKTPLTDL